MIKLFACEFFMYTAESYIDRYKCEVDNLRIERVFKICDRCNNGNCYHLFKNKNGCFEYVKDFWEEVFDEPGHIVFYIVEYDLTEEQILDLCMASECDSTHHSVEHFQICTDGQIKNITNLMNFV